MLFADNSVLVAHDSESLKINIKNRVIMKFQYKQSTLYILATQYLTMEKASAANEKLRSRDCETSDDHYVSLWVKCQVYKAIELSTFLYRAKYGQFIGHRSRN